MEYRRDMMLFKILKYCGNKVKAMENDTRKETIKNDTRI
jgi:hypothetical protein